MSTLATIRGNLSDLSKSDLFGKLTAMKRRAEASKAVVKHAAVETSKSGLAIVAGVGAAVLDFKAPTIGANGPRTDLSLGAAIAGANAMGLLDDAAPYVGTIGNVLLGCGSREYAREWMTKQGWQKSNLLSLNK
jgi:hypothetical protein